MSKEHIYYRREWRMKLPVPRREYGDAGDGPGDGDISLQRHEHKSPNGDKGRHSLNVFHQVTEHLSERPIIQGDSE